MIRSILAILAGYIVIVALVLAGTYALQSLKPHWFLDGAPVTAGYLATNITYSLVAAWIAGYVTAIIAGRAPMQHAFALAGVSVAMAVFAAINGAEQPRWFQLLRAAVMAAAIISAGWMRKPSLQTESQQDVAGDATAGGIARDRK